MKKMSNKASNIVKLIVHFSLAIIAVLIVVVCVIGCFEYVIESDNKSFKSTIEEVILSNEKEIVDIFTNERLKDSDIRLKYDDVIIREKYGTDTNSFIADLHGNTISYDIINNKTEKIDESEVSSTFVFMMINIIIETAAFVFFVIFVIRDIKRLVKSEK